MYVAHGIQQHSAQYESLRRATEARFSARVTGVDTSMYKASSEPQKQHQFKMNALLASSIASLCLHDQKHFEVQLHQTEHRLTLISKWNVDLQGAKVLELGCGQGDCTAVLAEAVGTAGHVTAVDPAALAYGELGFGLNSRVTLIITM